MRTLKNIVIGLVVIIILLVVISFFLPSKVIVARSKVIHGKPDVVFNQVNDLKNWHGWDPWHRKDPNMQITWGETTKGTGASYSWKSESDKVGNGSLQITNSVPNDSVLVDLNFMENGTAKGKFAFEPSAEGTSVTWSLEADMGMNPIKRFVGLMFDKWMGPDFEAGLNNIDSIVKNIPASPAYEIQLTTVTSQPALTIKDSGSAEGIGAKYTQNFGELAAYIKKSKLNIAGHAFAIVHSYTAEKMVLEMGMPTDKAGASNGRILSTSTPQGNAVMLKYYGAYDKIPPAYDAIGQWIKDNNKTIAGHPWEVYVTDPEMEKDTAKWETDIYFPVQ